MICIQIHIHIHIHIHVHGVVSLSNHAGGRKDANSMVCRGIQNISQYI